MTLKKSVIKSCLGCLFGSAMTWPGWTFMLVYCPSSNKSGGIRALTASMIEPRRFLYLSCRLHQSRSGKKMTSNT